MVDFAMDIYKELYQTDDVPSNMHERRAEVVQRLRTLQKAVEPIIGCLSNQNVIRNFRYIATAVIEIVMRFGSARHRVTMGSS
jgi:hypothetical protein